MPFSLFYLPFRPALDANGIVVAGARLTFYLSGTTMFRDIYADAGLTVPLANPLYANAAGVWPSIYLDESEPYRVVLTDFDGSTLDEVDPYVANGPSIDTTFPVNFGTNPPSGATVYDFGMNAAEDAAIIDFGD